METIKNRIIKNSTKAENGCWNWDKAVKSFGYGYMTIGSRSDGTRNTITAHRASYSEFKEPIPEGLWVLHKCDNPKCVNPDHLYLGTRTENVRDMVNRGRLSPQTGENNSNAKLSWVDVRAIRAERSSLKTPYRQMAKKYGLKHHTSVMDICNGKSWKEPEPPEQEKQNG